MPVGKFRKPQRASKDDSDNAPTNPIYVQPVAAGGGTAEVDVIDRANRVLGIAAVKGTTAAGVAITDPPVVIGYSDGVNARYAVVEDDASDAIAPSATKRHPADTSRVLVYDSAANQWNRLRGTVALGALVDVSDDVVRRMGQVNEDPYVVTSSTRINVGAASTQLVAAVAGAGSRVVNLEVQGDQLQGVHLNFGGAATVANRRLWIGGSLTIVTNQQVTAIRGGAAFNVDVDVLVGVPA